MPIVEDEQFMQWWLSFPQHSYQRQSVSLADLVPYQTIPDKFPHLYSHKTWVWAVKKRNQNGLAKAFRKVGRKLFVNTIVLAECINSQIE